MELTCFIFSLKVSEKIWSYKKCQRSTRVWSTQGLGNPTENILIKIEKYSKIGQDKKSLISALARFYCYCPSLISGGETGH